MFTKRQALASIAEVAAYFGVCRRTIRRRITHGLLPATKVGGKIHIKWSDVDALEAKGKILPDDDLGTSGLN